MTFAERKEEQKPSDSFQEKYSVICRLTNGLKVSSNIQTMCERNVTSLASVTFKISRSYHPVGSGDNNMNLFK